MNNYTLTASNITATSVTITLTHTSGNAPLDTQIIIVSLNNTEVSRQSIDDESLIDAVGESTSVNFSNLVPSTTYTVSLNSGDGIASNITFATLATTPAIVQLQNKNGDNIYPVTLDSRKATITMTDVDPGEGAALQENHFIAVYGDAAKIRTDDIAGGAVTSDKIDWTTVSLGETYALTSNIPSLPYTAYNGTNVLCSTGSQSFSGGTYILMMSSVSCYFSTINYQGFFAYRIDNGSWVHTDDWAQWGNGGSAGERSFMAPINISKGTHTIYIGFGTNSVDKTMTISQYQELSLVARITKVGG